MSQITVAIHGGSGSRAALRWVAHHVAHTPSRITLVGVRAVGSPATGQAEADLGSAALELRAIGDHLDVVTELRHGDPQEQLAAAAADSAADLLVVGTHASRSNPHSGLLTVAGRLAAHAPCPVIVVPAAWTPQRGPVVVGTSIDSASDAALDFAYELAERDSRSLVLAHVWKLPTIGETRITPGGGDSIPARQQASLDALRAATSARGATVAVSADLRTGGASAGLTAAVAAADASLLVVGRRARSAASRLMLGSTSRELITAPPCAIAVVPAPNGS
ncbi:MAG: universal stress protein [Pseudolysinimonas sp.]